MNDEKRKLTLHREAYEIAWALRNEFRKEIWDYHADKFNLTGKLKTQIRRRMNKVIIAKLQEFKSLKQDKSRSNIGLIKLLRATANRLEGKSK